MRRAVSPAAGPEQLAIAAESRRYLWSAAARILGEDERTALWLHYVEEMPVGEIAAVLDRSSVAVKTMMFRAARSSCRWLATWGRKAAMCGRHEQPRLQDNRAKHVPWIIENQSTSYDPLAEPLSRASATRTRPEFSARLHARLAGSRPRPAPSRAESRHRLSAKAPRRSLELGSRAHGVAGPVGRLGPLLARRWVRRRAKPSCKPIPAKPPNRPPTISTSPRPWWKAPQRASVSG